MPINQDLFLIFIPKCFLFYQRCFRHVYRGSKCPRYLVSSTYGVKYPHKVPDGQVGLLRVNGTWADILHLLLFAIFWDLVSKAWLIWLRLVWRCHTFITICCQDNCFIGVCSFYHPVISCQMCSEDHYIPPDQVQILGGLLTWCNMHTLSLNCISKHLFSVVTLTFEIFTTTVICILWAQFVINLNIMSYLAEGLTKTSMQIFQCLGACGFVLIVLRTRNKPVWFTRNTDLWLGWRIRIQVSFCSAISSRKAHDLGWRRLEICRVYFRYFPLSEIGP